MLRGASEERNNEYEDLVSEFKEEHRYEGREEEVAARIVNKQRAQHGETQENAEREARGDAPDEALPIDGYDHFTVDEITTKLNALNHAQAEQIRRYETANRNRKTLIGALDRHLRPG